ncbi:MAG: hypothetical protein ACOX0L_07510 [Natronincolaceae bacterium]|jgi:hypothetical protein|nr:hypothetical protein [Bacillota bacterium]
MDVKVSKTAERAEKIRYLSIILVWGAIWGIIEATIGNALHLLPFRVPTGSVLFPIGYFCMQKSFGETGDIKSMFFTASVAASIKFVNFFSPITPVIKVINPAACVLLEGLAVATVFTIYKYKDSDIGFKQSLIMSSSWRIGYYILAFGIFIPLMLMEASSVVGLSRFVEFFIINGLVNSMIIYAYGKIASRSKRISRIKYNLPISASLFLLAIFVTWII